MKIIVFAFIISMLPAQEVSIQEKSEKGSLSFSAGFIENIPRFDFGLGAELKFGSAKYWVIAYHHSAKLLVSSSSLHGYQSIVLGAGLSKISRFIRIGISIGPALVLKTNQSENVNYLAGININSQFIMTPFRDMGLGVEMNSNLNPDKYILGIRAVLFFQRTI